MAAWFGSVQLPRVWKRFMLCAGQKHRRCSMLTSSSICFQLRQKSWLLSPSLCAWVARSQWPVRAF